MKLFARPRKASTLAILRKSAGEHSPFQVLMLLRHRNNKFAPSRHVFPGGAMDAQDQSPGLDSFCAGLSPEIAALQIPDSDTPRLALASWITAIRETFEESALLYAYHADGKLLSFADPATIERFALYRSRIYHNQMTFLQMLEQEQLTLATDRIFYFSHWITPIFSPIRYDTRFFLAQAPAGQEVNHDQHELVEQNWIPPAEALKRYAQGNFRMVLPTIVTLEHLSRYTTLEAALAGVKNR